MITNFFLTIFYNFLLVLMLPITALSDVTLPANISSSISTASTYLGNINSVFPATTLIIILGIILGIEVFIILYKGINWLIRKIPTIN